MYTPEGRTINEMLFQKRAAANACCSWGVLTQSSVRVKESVSFLLTRVPGAQRTVKSNQRCCPGRSFSRSDEAVRHLRASHSFFSAYLDAT